MSESQRLADKLELDPSEWGGLHKVAWPAAAELRRLEAEVQALRGAVPAPQPAAQPTIDLSRLEPFVIGLGKAILQELKEDLAAQPAAQQEPFAYYNPAAKEIVMEAGQRDRYAKRTDGKGVGDYSRACTEPLYTRPAVPLTIAEVEQILAQWDYDTHGDRARYIVRMTEQAHKIGGAE